MSLVKSGVLWLQHNFAFSTSGAAWHDRLIALAFVLLAVLLAWLSMQVPFWLTLAGWGLYLAVVVIGSRQGWLKLFGPVLFYDMLRTARRSRYSIMRMLYGGALIVILSYMALLLFVNAQFNPNQRIQRRELALLAEMFFAAFMIVQLTIVVLLTPAYVAGAIAEEKDRKTLEFLLATDLRNREIVLSKLLSRLGNMTLLLLTGLPILSILQLIGGVDPGLVLSGFAATGLTMLGIAGVSILLSTLFRKPRDAISLTYLLMIAYAGLSLFLTAMQRHPWMGAPIWFGDDPPTLRSAVGVLNAGNPILAVWDVMQGIQGMGRFGGRSTLAAVLPDILTRYAWFHLVLAAVCISWSIGRLRTVALTQTAAGTTAALRWWQRYRPAVSDFPMLWKEFFIEGGMRLNWLIWLAVGVLVFLTLGIGLWIVAAQAWAVFVDGQPFSWDAFGLVMNVWFRIAGTGAALLLLLVLGVRAAMSITSERERNTFDALVTTPLSAEAILTGKLVGNLLGLRVGWLWLGGMLLLAVACKGVHPVVVPLLVLAWFVYALFCSMLGLAFSMFCQSSVAAAVWTVVTTLVLGGGHWLITSCCCMPSFALVMMGAQQQGGRDFSRPLEEVGKYAIEFQAGLTPPFVFPFAALSWQEVERHWTPEWHRDLMGFSVLGLGTWVVACVILWFAVLVPACRKIARREELEYR